MNMTNLASLLREDMTTISVQFVTNRTCGSYTYKCLKELAAELELGDLIAVDARNDDNYNDVGLAVVVEIHDSPQIDLDFKRPYKWVICKICVDVARAKQRVDEKVGRKLSERKMANCRDQALAAMGLSSTDARQLLQSLDAQKGTD